MSAQVSKAFTLVRDGRYKTLKSDWVCIAKPGTRLDTYGTWENWRCDFRPGPYVATVGKQFASGQAPGARRRVRLIDERRYRELLAAERAAKGAK